MTSDIFVLLDGEKLHHPATQATILAKYSRSQESARNTARIVTGEEADKFYSKWVVSYGHSSVAELATIPVCFEGVSMVASKFLESFPRGGYSEKSTRYQKFSRESFVSPPGSPSTLGNFAGRYFDLYNSLMPRMLEISAQKFGMKICEESFNSAKVKARAFDSLRYLLPAGTGTNLAAVMNLRDIRYLVSDARASENKEINEIGDKTFNSVNAVTPVLLEKAEPNWFEPKPIDIGHEFPISHGPSVSVSMHSGSDYDLKNLIHQRYGMPWSVFSDHMSKRGNRSVPEAFKSIRIGLNVTMDYGAYRDLQRHRRCEIRSDFLTPYIGYVIPDDIKGTEIEREYIRVMDSVLSYDDQDVIHKPWLYQYIVPMGFLHRSYFEMDLKELYYICELRTKPQGHISYRRIAYEMYEKAKELFPEAMQWCNAIKPEEIGEHH